MEGRRAVWRPISIGAAMGALAALAMFAGAFEAWNNQVTDRFFLSHKPDPSIAIVAIDDASLSAIGRWPWPRNVHARLIDALKADGARVIAYDVNWPEASTGSDDEALAQSIRNAKNVVLPVELQITKTSAGIRYDPHAIVRPIAVIEQAAFAVGHTNTPPDADGVIRRIPIAVGAPDGQEYLAFAAIVAEQLNPALDLRQIPWRAYEEFRISFAGAPLQTFPVYSAADVLNKRIPEGALRGKAVFVGATAPDLHDEQIVPTSGGVPMPGVEIHSSITDALLQGRRIIDVPTWIQAIALLLLGMLIGVFVGVMRMRYSVLAILSIWVGTLVASIVLFDIGIIFNVVIAFLLIVFAYAIMTLERRMTADADRRRMRFAFSRYVASPVVDSILRNPKSLELGGQKRSMTVLFSDVRGFTSLSESLPAEKLVHVLNTYLTRMTEVVFAERGVLDKYIGDAVMAFWNAPFDQKDHALRAVRTAIGMRRALAEMNRQQLFGPDIQLAAGVGINTGEMIVGNMGSDIRFDYTVIGDNVNLASRVEGLTKEYGVGILITEPTRKAAGDSILVRRLDKVAVKGKREPATLYEVLGLMSEATQEDVNLATDFEEAFTRYVNGEFETAIAVCGSILQHHPTDGPCRTIIARCHHFLSDPPPDEWDGTWVMTKK